MDKLISLADIVKNGYKQTHSNICIKGKKRYVKCGRCHKWTEFSRGPDKFGKITDNCFWCNGGITIKV